MWSWEHENREIKYFLKSNLHLRIPKMIFFWLECHLIIKKYSYEIHQFEFAEPAKCPEVFTLKGMSKLGKICFHLFVEWPQLEVQNIVRVYKVLSFQMAHTVFAFIKHRAHCPFSPILFQGQKPQKSINQMSSAANKKM